MGRSVRQSQIAGPSGMLHQKVDGGGSQTVTGRAMSDARRRGRRPASFLINAIGACAHIQVLAYFLSPGHDRQT